MPTPTIQSLNQTKQEPISVSIESVPSSLTSKPQMVTSASAVKGAWNTSSDSVIPLSTSNGIKPSFRPPQSSPPNVTTNHSVSNSPHFTANINQKPSVDRNSSSWMPFIRCYRLYQTPTPTKLLFVVNFHEPKYQAVPFIESQYFSIFRRRFLIDFDVVFVGPRGDQKFKVVGNGLPQQGYYSYHSLSFVYQHLCVEEECSYYGFVLMNDDSYVDPMFLMGYDLTQSWTEPSLKMDFKRRWQWYKWRNKNNVTYLEAFKTALEELKNTEEGKKCHFERPENWRRGFADFFYITQKDMKTFQPMITVMKRHLVFLEMAAPTVNYCITHNFVTDCNHGKMEDRRTCVHMHPVKYRLEGMKEFALDRLYHKNLDSTPKRAW